MKRRLFLAGISSGTAISQGLHFSKMITRVMEGTTVRLIVGMTETSHGAVIGGEERSQKRRFRAEPLSPVSGYRWRGRGTNSTSASKDLALHRWRFLWTIAKAPIC